jgi:hypothetical protein
MPGRFEEVPRALLGDAPGIHHHHPVANSATTPMSWL